MGGTNGWIVDEPLALIPREDREARIHVVGYGTTEDSVEAEVDGKPWAQEPFPYQGKCLQWLRVEYARLDGDDRARVDGILAGTGCEALVARPDA